MAFKLPNHLWTHKYEYRVEVERQVNGETIDTLKDFSSIRSWVAKDFPIHLNGLIAVSSVTKYGDKITILAIFAAFWCFFLPIIAKNLATNLAIIVKGHIFNFSPK